MKTLLIKTHQLSRAKQGLIKPHKSHTQPTNSITTDYVDNISLWLLIMQIYPATGGLDTSKTTGNETLQLRLNDTNCQVTKIYRSPWLNIITRVPKVSGLLRGELKKLRHPTEPCSSTTRPAIDTIRSP